MVIDNTISEIYYGDKKIDTMYFGDVQVWTKLEPTELTTGLNINNAINKSATKFLKSAASPSPDETVTDISALQDNSIVTWYDEVITTQYWYSPAQHIYMNSDSSGFFNNCTLLEGVDLSNFDASNVTNLSNMFNGCSFDGFTIVYGSKFVQSTGLEAYVSTSENVTYQMFNNCIGNKPENWTRGSWNTAGTFVKNAPTMTTNSDIVNRIDPLQTASSVVISETKPSGSGVFDISATRNGSIMFWHDASTNTDYIYADADKIYLNEDSSSMFSIFKKAVSIDLHKFDTSKVTNMHGMFNYCNELVSVDLSKFNTSKVTDMGLMFGACYKLKSLDLSSFDTSKVTSMSSMFDACMELTSIDVSNFDTSSLTNMSGMFGRCRSLKSIDISNLDTSKLKSFGVFSECESLTHIDLSNMDLSNAVSIGGFNGCTNLKSINFSGIKMDSSVITFSNAFLNCTNLKSVDLSPFAGKSLKSIDSMFSGCTALESVDLSMFTGPSIERMQQLFENCTSLASIILSDPFTPYNYSRFSYTDSLNPSYCMFKNCLSTTRPSWTNGTWNSEGTYIVA